MRKNVVYMMMMIEYELSCLILNKIVKLLTIKF